MGYYIIFIIYIRYNNKLIDNNITIIIIDNNNDQMEFNEVVYNKYIIE